MRLLVNSENNLNLINVHFSASTHFHVLWISDFIFYPKPLYKSLRHDFYSASSLKQQSADRHVASLGHIILIPSQPVFPRSVSLMMRA